MLEDLAALTATIAAGFFLAVAFYESLSTRDVLVGRTAKVVRRVTRNRVVIGTVYVVTVVVFIPVLVALWAIVLEVALGIVTSLDRVGVAEGAVAIVAAARVLAYIREKTSHELAKAIPLALAFAVLIGGLSQIEENLRVIVDEPLRSELTIEMIAFLVAIEIGLRLANDAIRALVGAVNRRRQRGSTPATAQPSHDDP